VSFSEGRRRVGCTKLDKRVDETGGPVPRPSDGETVQSAAEATFRLAMTCDMLTHLRRSATRIL
jgi:hypothetical protein